MTIQALSIGQVINYRNGGLSIYTGTIVEFNGDEIVVIDCEAGMQLLKAGIKNGSCIKIDQVIF